MLIWRISKLYEKITLIKPEHYGNVHHTAQIEMEWMQAMWFLMLLYKIFSPKYQIVSLMSTTLQKAAQGHIKLISFCCFLSFPSLNMFLQTLWECVQYSTHHITSHEWSPPLKKKITETGEGIIKPEVSVCDLQETWHLKTCSSKRQLRTYDFFSFLPQITG